MRRLSLFMVVLALSASNLMAGDRWIPIAGTAGNFRTDTRVFNPSGDKDIQVTARFLPVGTADNSARIFQPGVTFTVARRSQKVLDDVVTSLFSTNGIGAILLSSDDSFDATSRIYATVANGTLGQFAVAISPNAGLTKGVVLQLEQSASFRTNIGAVNLVNAPTTVTWTLRDKESRKVATQQTTMLPYEVLGPSNIASFFTAPEGTDLSDAWVTFEASDPLAVYGSIVDNGTTDQTYVPALADVGTDPAAPQTVTVTVVAEDFRFVVTPGGALKAGQPVRFILSKKSGSGAHGIRITDSNFNEILVADLSATPIERLVTLPTAGTYFYVCTNTVCDGGHGGHQQMTGDFAVSP